MHKLRLLNDVDKLNEELHRCLDMKIKVFCSRAFYTIKKMVLKSTSLIIEGAFFLQKLSCVINARELNWSSISQQDNQLKSCNDMQKYQQYSFIFILPDTSINQFLMGKVPQMTIFGGIIYLIIGMCFCYPPLFFNGAYKWPI